MLLIDFGLLAILTALYTSCLTGSTTLEKKSRKSELQHLASKTLSGVTALLTFSFDVRIKDFKKHRRKISPSPNMFTL